MPSFGQHSKDALVTCHASLIKVANAVIEDFDFQVLEGFRDEKAQNIAYSKGLSQKPWPLGNHNKFPSMAMDVAPYPVDFSDTEKAHQRFCYLAGYMMCHAKRLGIKLRWGGDWNQNQDTRDEKFRDLGHFEVID